MSRGELSRWHSPDPAVRARLVVIATPLGDHSSCVREGVEIVVVQAFVAKLPVEALDVGILRGLARGDELEIDAMTISPSIKRPTGEFRPLVGANRSRQASKLTDRLKYASHVAARDAVVD